MEEKILRIFIARGAEAQSSEMLTILSCCYLPIPSFLSRKHGEETGKPFPGRLCLWISAESVRQGCDAQSTTRSPTGEHWKGDRCQQLSGAKLYIWEHRKKSAQGNEYEAFSTLEHPGDSVFQEERVLVLLCMLDNSGTVLRTQLPRSWHFCETPRVTFASQPGHCFRVLLLKQSKGINIFI